MDDLFKFIGSYAIIVGAMTWLLKVIITRHIEHFYNKKAGDYKIEVNKYLFEHETRFSQLHEKRAEVIAEMYRLMIVAEGRLKTVVSPAGYEGQAPLKERAQKVWEAIFDFNKYFLEHEIYFNAEICLHIKNFLKEMKFLTVRSNRFEEDIKVWTEAEEKFSLELQLLKQKITEEFRKILGSSEINIVTTHDKK